MAEQTTNLHLKKPAYGDSADVKDFNDNMDTIDTVVKQAQDDIDAIEARLPDDNGDQYDVLRSNGDGTSEWVAYGLPTDEQTATAVSDWLDDHPEATTTVQDGAITRAKLDADLKEKTDAVPDLKSALQYNVDDITREMTYVRGDNLCRGDSTMTSGYMATNGTIYSNSNLVYSEKIPVIEGDVIRGYNTQDGSFAQRALRFVTAFDSSGSAVSASGLDNGWFYTVPSGITHIVVTIAVGTNYMISTGAVKTQYAPFSGYWKATDEFIGNLLDGYVEKNGQKQVTSDNIEDLIKTNKHTQSTNIFNTATLLATGKYVVVNPNGKLSLYTNNDYVSYIMPVDGTVYNFTMCRFAVLLEDDQETAIGNTIENATSINTTGASYIAFSFVPASYPVSSYVVTKTLNIYQAVNWELISGNNKTAKASASGEIASGGGLTVSGRTAIKDGELIVFKGYITSFGDGFKLNFYGASVTNYIEVTATQISVKYNSSAAVAVNHNLDFSSAHEAVLSVQFKEEKANIKLYADGAVYSVTYDWYQTGGTVTEPRIVSTGAVFSDATLIITYESAKRGIWYFGDSYISLSDERWPYYLKDDGYYSNVLLNGSPGCTSGGGIVAFNALLNMGLPKIAVFATGMNDGGDSGDTPSAAWVTSRDNFISLCENAGIEPVLCTVPSVPTVNNEAKNDWVRNTWGTNHRYIDFAKAVGATVSGGTTTWYTGMLSGDNVHPSALGAKALYTQLLIDFPEITI